MVFGSGFSHFWRPSAEQLALAWSNLNRSHSSLVAAALILAQYSMTGAVSLLMTRRARRGTNILVRENVLSGRCSLAINVSDLRKCY